MSSTNRGGKRSEADNYPTPPWVIRRLLEKCPLPSGRWLEPCAGDGEIIRAVNSKRSDAQWSTVELRPEMKEHLLPLTQDFYYSGDLMALGPEYFQNRRFDVAITNPPFSLAVPVLKKCLELADITVLLLRLNFWGSADRQEFLSKFPPDTYVLPQRPMFSINQKGKPGTDSVEYAWLVWRRSEFFRSEPRGSICVLGLTPAEERKTWTEHLRRAASQVPRGT